MACGQGIARADWRLTPSLAVEERYDNNVRFTQNQKSDDYVTAATSTLAFAGREFDLDVSGTLGSTYTEYVKHSDLSRFGYQGGAVINANALTGRLLKGLGLTVTENFLYTQDFPQFTRFGQPTDPNSGGVQAGRISTFGNVFGVTVPYEVSARTQVTGGYVNNLKIGRAHV